MMKKSSDKVLPQEHKDSHSKLESRTTSTESAPHHLQTASPTKHHSFGTNVVEKVHNIFHSSKHNEHEHHEHSAHEHIHEHVNPPIVETIVKPTVVEETIRHDKVIEVQPIVHRHIDAPEVHHIEKHVFEKIPPTGPARIVKESVIEETIQPHITEEVRTFVHREVPAPYIVHEEQHIEEHFVRPTIHTAEVIRSEHAQKATAHKNIIVEDVHVDDWSHQTVDQCPLALQEQQHAAVAPFVVLEKKVTFEEKPPLSAGGSRV